MENANALNEKERRLIEANRQAALFRLRQAEKENKTRVTKPQVPLSKQPLLNGSYCKIPVQNNSSCVSQKEVKVTIRLRSNTRFELEAIFHVPLIEICKKMPTVIYDHSTRLWHFELKDYYDLLKKIRELPEVKLDTFPSFVRRAFKSVLDGNIIPEKDINDLSSATLRLYNELPKNLVNELMPFQRLGIARALEWNGRILLADDMGLGKSVQSLSIAACYESEWPLLIICPSSVKFNWKEQVLKWLGPEKLGLNPDDVKVIVTVKDIDSISDCSNCKIYITSYDLLTRSNQKFQSLKFKVVIVDESHFLKNHRTARTKNVQTIIQDAKRVLLLSGTPALSRPVELLSQLTSVNPTLFNQKSVHEFGLRYCDGRMKFNHWDYSGCSNMPELQILLRETVMIRREKKEVIDQLPSKRREMIILDPSIVKKTKEMKLHAQRLRNNSLSSVDKNSILLQYYHETALIKIPAVIQYVSDLLESDRKFLLFAHHNEMMNNLAKLLEENNVDYMRIDGKTDTQVRHINCERFQNQEKCQVALLSINAANAGITLTAASLVVFAELAWNPGQLVQAEDRAYRIGQKDSVTVQYLIASGTADDDLWRKLQLKLEVLNKAGLNTEDFRQADTTHAAIQDSGSNSQTHILDYFNLKKEENIEELETINESDWVFSDNDTSLLDADTTIQKSGFSSNSKRSLDLNSSIELNSSGKKSCLFSNPTTNLIISPNSQPSKSLVPASPEIVNSNETYSLDSEDLILCNLLDQPLQDTFDDTSDWSELETI